MNSIILQGLGPSPSLLFSGYGPIASVVVKVKKVVRWFPGLSRARRLR